jgi:hypothetical protein
LWCPNRLKLWGRKQPKMYIYIDESGDFGLSDRSRITQPYFVVAILLIKDKQSKSRIAQAVTRAIIDWRRYHQKVQKEPEYRIQELKGTLPPDVRWRLLRLVLRKKCDFEIFAMGIDKRDRRLAVQKLPNAYMRRYAMLVHNILFMLTPEIGRNQRWITMVCDSQARADPMPSGLCRYRSKKVRIQQVRLRKQDKQRQTIYRDFVIHRFRAVLRKRGIHLAVWLKRSESDRCLQFAHVIVNFIHEGMVLRNERKMLKEMMYNTNKTKLKQRIRKELDHAIDRLNKWNELLDLMKPQVHFRLSYRLYDKQIYYRTKPIL